MKEKRTGKKLFLSVLIGVICLIAAACGTEEIEEEVIPETDPPATTAPPETEPATTEFPEILDEYLAKWEENNDLIGWLRIEDKLDEPVVQGEDNDFYSNHNFNRVPSFSGTILADYKNRFNGFDTSDNTLLYGHNMKNGTFFKPLQFYYTDTIKDDLDYYKKYPVVEFDTLYEKSEWKIFAVVLYNTQPQYGEVIEFWEYTDFDTEDDFHDYILTIMDRSVLFTDVDIEYGDKILSLMTCWYPDGLDCRIVVHARKVRPGESSKVDVSKAKYNKVNRPYASGEKWVGEIGAWDAKKYLKSYKPEASSTKPKETTSAHD